MTICNESPFCLAVNFLHPAISILQNDAYSHTLQFYTVGSRELDSMILMSPFQLDILCDSLVLLLDKGESKILCFVFCWFLSPSEDNGT